jgi:hypothetical protein
MWDADTEAAAARDAACLESAGRNGCEATSEDASDKEASSRSFAEVCGPLVRRAFASGPCCRAEGSRRRDGATAALLLLLLLLLPPLMPYDRCADAIRGIDVAPELEPDELDSAP